MRTGGSLVQNILSINSKISVFSGVVHFFRFIYNRYNPLTVENVERMLHHLRIRLKYRLSIELEVEPILKQITSRRLSYDVCYDEIMKYLLGMTGKQVWGEYVTLGWREIPKFIEMFPHGKVVHIYRDLRGIIASFGRLSFMPDNLYLNCIFNWIDSINYMRHFKENISPDNYKTIRFEDIHDDPNSIISDLCGFLEVPFEDVMVQPEKWPSLFDGKFVDANISVYTKEKVYGFEPKRSIAWRDALKDWEIILAEFLAKEQLEYAGYECTLSKFDVKDLNYGMDLLKRQQFLRKNLTNLIATGEGSDKTPNDPTDPKNWGSPVDGFAKFVDSPVYQKYIDEINEAEDLVRKKY